MVASTLGLAHWKLVAQPVAAKKIRNHQTQRDRKQISGYVVSLRGDENPLKRDTGDRCTALTIPRAANLYALTDNGNFDVMCVLSQ